jgi:hypothetical protein
VASGSGDEIHETAPTCFGRTPALIAIIGSGSGSAGWRRQFFGHRVDLACISPLGLALVVSWRPLLIELLQLMIMCFENLWDLAQWISRATLYIGNDTGSTHLAAATGTETIALFGPSNPAIFGPRAAHVRIERFMPFAEPERLKREDESVLRAAMDVLELERMKPAV